MVSAKRRLRVLNVSALDLDDPAVIERAASEALIEPGELRAWMADPEVDSVLEADKRASRTPLARLARAGLQAGRAGEEERRYTCPSYELIRVTEPPVDWPTASRVDLPGTFLPVGDDGYWAAVA